jgi:hypothetical protein
MKKIVLFASLASVSLLFNQCKKEPMKGRLLGEIRLTEDELSYMPYEENDSLKFKNSSGNIKLLWVTSKVKGDQIAYEDAMNYNSNYHHLESLTIQFADINGNSQKIEMKTQTRPERTLVHTSFSPPNMISNDSALVTFDSYMDGNKFSTSTDAYHPSITIGNKTFYTVYELVNTFVPYANVDNLNRIFYAKNRGIVGFKTQSGEEWFLDN